VERLRLDIQTRGQAFAEAGREALELANSQCPAPNLPFVPPAGDCEVGASLTGSAKDLAAKVIVVRYNLRPRVVFSLRPGLRMSVVYETGIRNGNYCHVIYPDVAMCGL
jgi:hypothetical protein